MKLVLASDNKNKLREFRTLFENFGVEFLSKADTGFTEEVEETGETFAENARIKAEAVMRFTGLPAIADDSGLCVDALGGEPGVRSARYTGSHADSDADRYELLLRNLGETQERGARFVCSLCCVFPNGDILTAEGTCEGSILFAPRGEGGIPENVVRQTEEALAARELIKGRVLDTALLSAREACDALCEACGADGVQVIGSKFVLFKQNEKAPRIVLIKDRKGKK